MMGELKKEIAIFKPIFPYPTTPAARVVACVFLSHFISISEMKGAKNVDLSCFMHAWMVTFDQFRDIKSDFLEGFCPELLLPGTLFELAHGFFEDCDKNTPPNEIAAKKSRKVLIFTCSYLSSRFPVFLFSLLTQMKKTIWTTPSAHLLTVLRSWISQIATWENPLQMSVVGSKI